MFGIAVLAFMIVGLSYHVRELAPERGRSALAWIGFTLFGSAVGFAAGSLLLASLIASDSSGSAISAIVLNPIVLACVGAVAVTIALHELPVAAVRLRGNEWDFDRLDTGRRIILHVSDTLRLREGVSAEGENPTTSYTEVVDPAAIVRIEVDGECVVLVIGNGEDRKSIALRPAGLASREMRARFAEAVRNRIRTSLIRRI